MTIGLQARLSQTRSWRRSLFLALLVIFLASGFGRFELPTAIAFQGDDQQNQDNAGDAPPDPVEVERESFLTVVAKANGLFFGPVLLLVSFVMVAMVVINIMQIRRDILLPPDFIEEFEQRLAGKDYQGAFEVARNDDSFVARVLAAGLTKLNRGYNEAIEGMQEVGEDENMALEHRISYLALIGSIAPMIGLMGTVWGMIGAFEEIATSATQPKPKDLARNIYTALFTTLEGLMIAIPAMVSYNMLRNRVARYVLEVGMVSEGLMSRFSGMGKNQASTGATSSSGAPSSSGSASTRATEDPSQ